MPRILFIGNSYTSRNNLPRIVADLAAATEPSQKVDFALVAAGGASLRRHWNAGRAQELLQTKPWDYVVLQEQSTLPLKNPARYHDNARLFSGPIAQHGARVLLYLTWSRQSAPQTQDALTRAVCDIAREIGARVVPVGPAWHRALEEIPDLHLYTSDGSHPTAAGSYLAACVFHVTLFDAEPRADSVVESLGIERRIARRLEGVAWNCRTFRAVA